MRGRASADLGYLRHAYKREDGTLGYRCPSEPIEDYVEKGGDLAETRGRKCLCNGLMANIGLAQRRPTGYVEQPLVTTRDDLQVLAELVSRWHGVRRNGCSGCLLSGLGVYQAMVREMAEVR